jgi:two-component system, OmpR family, response regulator
MGVIPDNDAESRDSCENLTRNESNTTTEPTRVFVINGDPSMHCMLADYLEQHNMAVVGGLQRQEALTRCAAGEPSVVLLDFCLGQEDGLDLLREIRSRSDVPVIITNHPGDESDRVIGLELGADDYVPQPIIVPLIRAVQRRRDTGLIAAQRHSEQGRSRFGGWELDRRGRRLTHPEGEVVPLTHGEYALLVAFLNAPFRPLSREQLLQATRIHEDLFDRSIDVQILRLRRKLGDEPSAPRFIRTERGIGYVFSVPVEPF